MKFARSRHNLMTSTISWRLLTGNHRAPAKAESSIVTHTHSIELSAVSLVVMRGSIARESHACYTSRAEFRSTTWAPSVR